jgi:phosphoribosylcarboxyaminoimidazole (NCAIR) mutase
MVLQSSKGITMYNNRIFISLFMICHVSQASWWDDVWSGVKSAANTADDAFKTAGNEIKAVANKVGDEIVKRFQDTQTTRAIDFGIQIAAFETAKAAAIAAQKTSEGVALAGIRAGKGTTLAALTAAQETLDKVGKPISDAALAGPREAAHQFLEASKIVSVGTLDASKWVADNVLNQFDINEITFRGDLQKLKQGVFVQTHIRGTLFQKDFSGDIDLSVKSVDDVLNSCKSYIERATGEIKNFFDTTAQSMNNLFQHQKEINAAKQAIAAAQPTPINIAAQQSEQADNALATANKAFQTAQNTITATLTDAQKQLNAYAKKTTDELKSIIAKQSTGAASTQARQELTRRLR